MHESPGKGAGLPMTLSATSASTERADVNLQAVAQIDQFGTGREPLTIEPTAEQNGGSGAPVE
jgi:hypothetical protein